MPLHPRLVGIGILLGFIGLFFYANFREPSILFDRSSIFSLFSLLERPILLPQAISEWIPSFLHIIGMSTFTAGFFGVRKGYFWKIPMAWLVIDITFEALQYFETSNILTWGNFEWVDIAAMSVATLVSIFWLKRYITVKERTAMSKKSGLLISLSAGCFMMLGSYSEGCPNGDCSVNPLYMSWETLRTSGYAVPTILGRPDQRMIEDINNIYIYKDFLLVNEDRTGVHIYDNSDPANIKYYNFISLIGNQGIAIKGQYLYLDSFTDLVIFDLENIFLPPKRIELMFALPKVAELLPSWANFSKLTQLDILSDKGIIVGYIDSKGQEFMFWPGLDNVEVSQ